METHDGRVGQGRHRRPVSLKVLVLFAAASVVAGACSTGTSPAASGSLPASPGSPTGTASKSPAGAPSCEPANPDAGMQTSPSFAAGAAAPALLVLADCVDGGIGLWRLDAAGIWTTAGPAPDGQAIARDGDTFTILRPGSLETRTASQPAVTAGTVPLKWPSAVPSAPMRAVDQSPAGKTAIVFADGNGETYSIASADGTVTPLQGAPESSFTPLVGWIDADRLLVLSDGTDATSRIVVMSTGLSQTIPTLIGVRWFALSGDRSTVAIALDSGIYVSPVSALLGGAQPTWIGSVAASQKVLDLVLDRTGANLAALVNATKDDGMPVNTRELGYTKTSSGWKWTYDGPVPFTKALGQAWLG